jgi:hypothetical protein
MAKAAASGESAQRQRQLKIIVASAGIGKAAYQRANNHLKSWRKIGISRKARKWQLAWRKWRLAAEKTSQ